MPCSQRNRFDHLSCSHRHCRRVIRQEREEKYKAKNFIDTAISRGGDASTAWLVTGVKALGATSTHIAWALVPMMGLWAWLATVLARHEKRRSVSTPF
jgi:ATP:ADP antiporter, AAA family